MSAPLPAPSPKRSGSQKRERTKVWQIAMTPAEYAMQLAKAREAGLSASSYGRALLMAGDPGLRARRTPTVDAEALARATAALNKAGSNLNQIARASNAGRTAGAREISTAVAEVRDILALFRAAVRMKDPA